MTSPADLLRRIRGLASAHASGECTDATKEELRQLCRQLKPDIHTLKTNVCLIDALETKSVTMVEIPLSMDTDEDMNIIQIVPDLNAMKDIVALPKGAMLRLKNAREYGTMCIWDEIGHTEYPGFKLGETLNTMRGNALLFDDIELSEGEILVCIPRDYEEVKDDVVFLSKEQAQLNQLNEYERMKRMIEASPMCMNSRVIYM
jgi:hypothetical protein